MRFNSISATTRPGILLVTILLLVGNACRGPQTFSKFTPEEKTLHLIDSLCNLNLVNEHYPGLAISVINGKGAQWNKGYGYANLTLKQAINPSDHLFRIGSISKTVTASAMARLKEKNKIDLDAPISTYIPDLPEDKKEITLRQLGGHTSGIRHYKGIEFLSNIHYETVPQAMEVFISDDLLFTPGSEYSYTTYGWTIISAAMENVAELPILRIIDKEIRQPLRIPDLKGDELDSIQFNRVEFYEYQSGKLMESPATDLSNKWSGGGLLCSAEDLARFGFYHTGPVFLKPETLQEFTTSQILPKGIKTNYGIGFRCGTDSEGNDWYGHSGGSVGGTSMLLIFPEEDLVVVTLVNMGSANMNDLAWKIADVIRQENPQ